MSTVIRRKMLGSGHEAEHDPVKAFVMNRERRLEASLARRNSKSKIQMQRPASQSGLRHGAESSTLAHSGSAVVLGRPRGESGTSASSSKATEASKAFNAGSRRWTVDMAQEEEDDILSPKWVKPNARRAVNRLGFEEPQNPALTAANLSRLPTLEDAGDEKVENEETSAFIDISSKLHNWVNQAVMRTVKLFTKVRDNHKEKPAMLSEKQNFERLCCVSFLIATTNYRMSKWLWQLKPHSYVKPSKPVDVVDEHRAVDELLGEVQFSLSRMEVLASDLMPKLGKIVSDAKKQEENPRYMTRAKGADNEPLSPGCANPVRLAQKRGIRDVREMQGIMSHLERLLEVAHSLAHKPAGAAQVKVTATIIMAAARFKKGLKRRRAREAAGAGK